MFVCCPKRKSALLFVFVSAPNMLLYSAGIVKIHAEKKMKSFLCFSSR